MSGSDRPRALTPSLLVSLRALVRRGLRDNRRAPLTWGGSLGAFGAMILFVWPSIEDSVGELVEAYPEGLREAFGIDQLNTPEAYYDAELLSLIVPFAVAFLAVRVVARAISTPEERAWLDTLLATPLSRERLVAGTAIVTAVTVAAVLAMLLVTSMLAGLLAGVDPSFTVIGRGVVNVWPLAMFFAGLAVLVAGRLRGAGTVTAISIGALVTMYLLDVIGKIADSIEPLRWASVFRYYGSAVRDGIDPLAFAGLTLAGVALAALGALLLRSRDLDG